jgi:hypothetical protein
MQDISIWQCIRPQNYALSFWVFVAEYKTCQTSKIHSEPPVGMLSLINSIQNFLCWLITILYLQILYRAFLILLTSTMCQNIVVMCKKCNVVVEIMGRNGSTGYSYYQYLANLSALRRQKIQLLWRFQTWMRRYDEKNFTQKTIRVTVLSNMGSLFIWQLSTLTSSPCCVD